MMHANFHFQYLILSATPKISPPKLTNQIPSIREILLQPNETVLWVNYNPVITTPELIARGEATALKPRLTSEYDPIHNSEDAMLTKRMPCSPMPQLIMPHTISVPFSFSSIQYHKVLY
uniref:Uncharacterized protein n=1 Tax=Ananas comosus var. bracteatus TaxID=296719 RepID=A0A6V7Q9Q8_ANACO|nr:unnamed protein product [Ananas comosus var. bracteatus]